MNFSNFLQKEKQSNEKHIILFWKQWSGKWTHANFLKATSWYAHFETSSELKKLTSDPNSKLWKSIKSKMNSWELIDDEIIKKILINFLQQNKWKNIVFDGCPRTIQQYYTLKELLNNYKIINLEITDEEAIKRITWRFDENWNKRIDDQDPESIQKRMNTFKKETLAILDKAKEDGVKIINIDSSQDINSVQEKISKQIQETINYYNSKILAIITLKFLKWKIFGKIN